jgi:hypothetical protein
MKGLGGIMEPQPQNHIQSHNEDAKSYLISQSSFESDLEEFLNSLDATEDDAVLWAPHLHDEVVFELPFAAQTSIPTLVKGKGNVLEYIREWYGLFADFSICNMKVHRMEEDGTYVLEYKTKGFVASTARPYSQENIALIKVKDHKIIFFREYWNPIHLLEAFGDGFSFRLNLNFIDLKSVEPF